MKYCIVRVHTNIYVNCTLNRPYYLWQVFRFESTPITSRQLVLSGASLLFSKRWPIKSPTTALWASATRAQWCTSCQCQALSSACDASRLPLRETSRFARSSIRLLIAVASIRDHIVYSPPRSSLISHNAWSSHMIVLYTLLLNRFASALFLLFYLLCTSYLV